MAEGERWPREAVQRALLQTLDLGARVGYAALPDECAWAFSDEGDWPLMWGGLCLERAREEGMGVTLLCSLPFEHPGECGFERARGVYVA